MLAICVLLTMYLQKSKRKTEAGNLIHLAATRGHAPLLQAVMHANSRQDRGAEQSDESDNGEGGGGKESPLVGSGSEVALPRIQSKGAREDKENEAQHSRDTSDLSRP